MMKQSNEIGGKALKAGTWYIISNFLTKALSILTVPIFSRLLTTEDYGVVSNFTAWVGILTIVLSLDLYASIQRAKLDFDDTIDEFLSSILIVASLACLVFFVWVNAFSVFAQSVFSLSVFELNLMCVYILFYNAFSFLQTKHRVYLKYKTLTFLSIASSVLSVICSLALVFLMENLSLAKILGTYAPITIISIVCYWHILKKGRFACQWKYCKYALTLSVPLIVHALAGNILSQFDRIMLTNISGYEQVGLYSMIYNFATVIAIVWASFSGAWTPWFYEALHNEMFDEIRENSKKYLLLFCVIVLGVIAFSPEILRILAPAEYYEGVIIIPILLIGIVFQFVYSMYINVQFYHKNTKIVPIGTLLAAGLNIALNAMFIPHFGYRAAAVTTLLGYLVLFAFNRMIAKKMYDMSYYNEKYFFTLIVILILMSALYALIFDYFMLRFVFTVIWCVLLLFKYKADLLKLIKSTKNKKI